MLLIAMNLIFVACILYTIGVWSEKIQGRLKAWHLIVFWLGLFFDTIGTGAMGINAGSLIQFNFHGITGMSAILLMLFHSIWASVVIFKNQREKILTHCTILYNLFQFGRKTYCQMRSSL